MSEKKPEHRGRPAKADKAEQTAALEKPETEKVGKTQKKERKPRTEKQKPASVKKAPLKEETPTPEPEKPQEPKEAPRKGETEQIVFLNLSELHAFKNHPFGVRDDEEMRAMVESVKDKNVRDFSAGRLSKRKQVFQVFLRYLRNRTKRI